MTTKSTPGPWLHKPGANDYGCIGAKCSKEERASGWKGVASAHGQDDEVEQGANIRLIAAAPTLADALRNLCGPGAQYEHECDKAEHDGDGPCIWCETRAALALVDKE